MHHCSNTRKMISVSELQEDVLHDKHFQEQSGQEGVLNKEACGGEEHGAGGEEVEGAEKRKLGIGRGSSFFFHQYLSFTSAVDVVTVVFLVERSN